MQIARAAYKPKLPSALCGAVKVIEGEATQSVANQDEIKALFPNTYGMPIVEFESSEAENGMAMNVGVILSGGQAPGGHNVITGLFDTIKKIASEGPCILVGRCADYALEDFDNVYIVDSKSLSTGIALLAIKAAQLAQDGLDAKTIAHEMEYKREKVVTTFILDKLEFLYKGGRCSGVAMLGANVLGIKPSIVMVDGKLQVGKKYRGKLENCQMQYVRDLLEQYAGRIDTDRAFLSRTAGVSDEQMKALQKEIHKTLKFKEYIVSTVGCTITSHCGERTFTFEFMLK